MKTRGTTIGILLNWGTSLVIIHILAMLVYSILLNRMVRELETDKYISNAYVTVLAFGLIFICVYATWSALKQAKFTEYRTMIKSAIVEGEFSLTKYFAQKYLKIELWKSLVYFVFQIPFIIFFSFFGFVASQATIIEKFYILEAGIYHFSKISLLGAIISTSFMMIVSIIAQFVVLLINYKYIMENSPSLKR